MSLPLFLKYRAGIRYVAEHTQTVIKIYRFISDLAIIYSRLMKLVISMQTKIL